MDIRELSYNRIADALLQEAAGRNAGAFSRLASERELADKYNCSRVTIRKALGVLEEHGCISRVKGQGTFWVEPARPAAEMPKPANWRMAVVVFNAGMEHGLLRMLDGVEHATERNNLYSYSFWHLDTGRGDAAERFPGLADADGYIVTGDFRLADLTWFINTRKPLVVLGQAVDRAVLSMASRPFSLVRLDTVRGWEMAAEQLFCRGCRRPAVLVASRHQGYADRREGVLLAMRRAGIPEGDCRFVIADPETDQGSVSAEKLYAGVERLWTEADDFDCLLTTIEPVLVVAAAQRRGIAADNLFPIIAECNQKDMTPQVFGIDTLSDDLYVAGVHCAKSLLELLEGRAGYTVVNLVPHLTSWRKTDLLLSAKGMQ